MKNFFLSIVIAFVSSFGYGIIANTPKRVLLPSGLIGCIGWSIYIIIKTLINDSIFLPNIFASCVIGCMASYYSKKFNTPETNITAGALIPLVPGGVAFLTFQKLKEENINLIFSGVYNIIGIAVALTIGFSLSSLIINVLNKYK